MTEPKKKGARAPSTYRGARRMAAKQHAKEAKVSFHEVWVRSGYRTYGRR